MNHMCHSSFVLRVIVLYESTIDLPYCLSLYTRTSTRVLAFLSSSLSTSTQLHIKVFFNHQQQHNYVILTFFCSPTVQLRLMIRD